MQAFSKFCPKLNIQKILLPTIKHPGGEDTNLLMGRVVKNWKNLEKKYYLKWKPYFWPATNKTQATASLV